MEFKYSMKRYIKSQVDTSNSMWIPFDAIITDAVDNFAQSFESLGFE